MRMFGTEELEPMRREINDQQSPAGCQETADLAYRPGRIVEEVQYLMHHDQVEGIAGEGRSVNVALAKIDAADLGTLEVGACNREHRVAAVEADGAFRVLGEQLQHASGSGADVEQRCVGGRADRLEDRLLDDCIRCVQRTLFVPPRGDPGEVLLSSGSAATANNRQPIE